ncbi:MAG: histidine phosphotransferase family protein [Pseudomonadota bacterium]
MQSDPYSLATLIGSRICHDLISPLGAVSNGLELLLLSGTEASPELALVAQSVANANARIRFFRLAFGIASADQMIGAEEINSILKDVYTDGRITAETFPSGSFPRAEVRAVMLALLCAEQAVPYGGTLAVTQDETGWSISATGDRLSPNAQLWDVLAGVAPAEDVPPSAVQFLMLRDVLPRLGMICSTGVTETAAGIHLKRASSRPLPQGT